MEDEKELIQKERVFAFLKKNKVGYFTTKGLHGKIKQSLITHKFNYCEDQIPVIEILFEVNEDRKKHRENVALQLLGKNPDPGFRLVIINRNERKRAVIYGQLQLPFNKEKDRLSRNDGSRKNFEVLISSIRYSDDKKKEKFAVGFSFLNFKK